MMKIVRLLLLILISVCIASAQTSNPLENPSDLVIKSISKKQDSHMTGPANVKSEGKSALSEPDPPKDATAIEPVGPTRVPSVAGYSYQATVKNVGTKEIKSVTWVYVFFDALDGRVMARHTFTSKVKLGPGAEKKLEGFAAAQTTNVINAKSVSKNPDKPFNEQAFILRIEYLDGSAWERRSK